MRIVELLPLLLTSASAVGSAKGRKNPNKYRGNYGVGMSMSTRTSTETNTDRSIPMSEQSGVGLTESCEKCVAREECITLGFSHCVDGCCANLSEEIVVGNGSKSGTYMVSDGMFIWMELFMPQFFLIHIYWIGIVSSCDSSHVLTQRR